MPALILDLEPTLGHTSKGTIALEVKLPPSITEEREHYFKAVVLFETMYNGTTSKPTFNTMGKLPFHVTKGGMAVWKQYMDSMAVKFVNYLENK